MATYSANSASNPSAARAAASPGTTVEKPKSGRLLSLDVFRGATILAMILVNNPGGGEGYWPLEHADWHGWTPTDLIFPFFLFIVGTSLSYSLRKFRNGAEISPGVYWRIFRRTALLIFLGWMPSLLLKTIHAAQGQTVSLEDLRLFGVLVRIALVYCCTSLIVLHVPLRGQVVLATVILLGYWATLAFLPDPHDYWKNLSNDNNVTVVVDRALVGDKHMYHGDPPTEPEGFLSTFPSIVSALIGYWAGLFIQRRGINFGMIVSLFCVGALCLQAGMLWGIAFPINKKIWTSSFVLLTGGLAMELLAGSILLFDIKGWRRLARPFEIVGINAIFVFVCSGLLGMTLGRNEVAPPSIDSKVMQTLRDAGTSASREQLEEKLGDGFTKDDLAGSLKRLARRHWINVKHDGDNDTYSARIKATGEKVTLHGWLYYNLWTSWIDDPKLASLCMALTTVTFWWFVCWIMSLLGWSIRV